MPISRRRFLQLTAAVAAATGLPARNVAIALEAGPSAAQAAAELTTLAATLGPGSPGDLGYRPVVTLGGQPRVVRDELATAQDGREQRRRSLLCFVHLTDQHIIDVQSTTRVEFLDRYADGPCSDIPFSSAHRPQEAAGARIMDAMHRRLRRIGVSPVTGAPIAAAICTGDNTDNQQGNELDVHLAVMNGQPVTLQSGDPEVYEGVQTMGDPAYWHPNGDVDDRYRREYGFPVLEGWLEEALAPFDAVGVGVPWYSAYGNHDGLAQGNAPINPAFGAIAEGPLKVVGLPPGTDPCNAFDDLGFLPVAPTQPTTADPARQYITRGQWIQRHIDAGGVPVGHGFTQANVDAELAYYAAEVGEIRWLVLDTVNPGGVADGSIGANQLAWIDAQLAAAEDEGKLVMLFSHHGLRSLTNPVDTPDPLRDPGFSDLPRQRADDVLPVLLKYRCLIGWVNGHTHNNIVEHHTGADVGDESLPGAFWDIGTAAHIDWPSQARIVEVVDNRDGTLSIFGTLFDFETDVIADRARELMGNDPQKGFAYGVGGEEDRNVELLLTHPFPQTPTEPGPSPTATPTPTPPPGQAPEVQPAPALPATGIPAGLTVGGALALASAVGLRRFTERVRTVSEESSER